MSVLHKYRGPISEGQYRRHLAKSEQARRNVMRHCRRPGHSLRRFRYWQNALHRLGKCNYRGCQCRPVNDYWYEGWHGDDATHPPDEMLCYEHAARAGFCVVCSSFVAGIDDIELMDAGMCSECAREHRQDRERAAFTKELHHV